MQRLPELKLTYSAQNSLEVTRHELNNEDELERCVHSHSDGIPRHWHAHGLNSLNMSKSQFVYLLKRLWMLIKWDKFLRYILPLS